MPNFIDLDKATQNYLIRQWLTESQRLVDGDDGGVTGVNYILPNGNREIIANRPTLAELKNFKESLVLYGMVDRLLGNIYLGDFTQLYTAKTLNATTDKLIYGTETNSEALRKLGYTTEEVKNETMNKAITNPKEFIKEKYADIKKVNQMAYDAWKKSYAKYREFGYDEEDAFQKAKKTADAYKSQLMVEHEKEYPSTVEKDAKSRIVG